MSGVISLDFATCNGGVLETETLHQDPLTVGHRRADAHAKDMWHGLQEIGRAPAANKDVALSGELQYFLRRVERHARAVELPTFEQRSFPFKDSMHLAFGHAGTLGDVMLDDLVMNDRKSPSLSKARGNFTSAGCHLARHGDNGHRLLPRSVAAAIAAPRGRLPNLHPGCQTVMLRCSR